MKIKLNTIVFLYSLALALFVTFQMNGQGFLKTSNKKIVNGNGEEVILRGMGLGGWMLQEGYMMQTADFANTQHELKKKISDLIGEPAMEAFYDAWLANGVREIDIDSMAAWGFNSVRLPIHYNLFTLPIEEELVQGKNTWLQKGFDLTDSLLKWCSKNHIYLILDLHAAPGGQGKDQPISDYDPTKPSLWESTYNWKKTVSLWKKLAEHYANEEWIGGYDLINETNWDLPNNTMLKNLYREITDSIRLVDQEHIIFIEGNWFANDFTGLTPPWDNNMAYSFHKYWTYNNKSSIQWMLDIRENQNIPIWLGESGENSNTWFKECIQLLEENNIGWAWWPLKKIGSISGPLSGIKTDEYQTLLNYWKGQGSKPSVEFASNALMQMAENMNLENCEYHPDVIDAMFRQQVTSDTKPYAQNNIPGIIYATSFDLGPNGYAYFDTDTADYHLSTNTYTSWNSGWMLRNDGADIEGCSDLPFSNGYNVANTKNGEWLQYTVQIAKTALYNVNLRVASTNSSGNFHFREDSADVCSPINVSASGSWQNWKTITVNNIVLLKGEHKIRFFIDAGGFNVNRFEFVESGELSSVPAEFVSAETGNDEYTIKVNINKPIASGISESISDFKISVNGTEVPVNSVTQNTNNSRIINIGISKLLFKGNTILVSYTGNKLIAIDGTTLGTFSNKEVKNTLINRYQIPAKIQAEDYYYNNGLTSETCTDTGAGKDMGYTDQGDYLDYLVYVSNPGTYLVEYRVAALNTAGQIELQLLEADTSILHTIDIPSTGGWQTWSTVSKNLDLPQGKFKLRLIIKKSGFNINWFKFSLVTGMEHSGLNNSCFKVFPNPTNGIVFITHDSEEKLTYQLLNLNGHVIINGNVNSEKQMLDFSKLKNGIYILNIASKKGQETSYKIILKN